MEYGLIIGGDFDSRYIFKSVKEARAKAIKLILANVNVTAVVGVKDGRPYYGGHSMQVLDVMKLSYGRSLISCSVWSSSKKTYIFYHLNNDGSLDMKGTKKRRKTEMHPFGL